MKCDIFYVCFFVVVDFFKFLYHHCIQTWTINISFYGSDEFIWTCTSVPGDKLVVHCLLGFGAAT